MKAHRAETIVSGDGSVTVRGVPFEQGEAVEVIILPRASTPDVLRQSLEGSVRRFSDPFEPAVGADGWEAVQR